MRKVPLVIALWAGTAFGLIEGILLSASRGYPAVLAPDKLSAHVLWFAPLYDATIYSLVAFGLVVLFWLLKNRVDAARWTLSVSIFVFTFLGTFSVLFSLRVIHLAAALILALGLTLAIVRRARVLEDDLVNNLTRRLVLIPSLLLALALGTFGWEIASETWQHRRLPPASPDSPNVLVIVLDTVRYDRFTEAGQNGLLPHLDHLARRGVRYTNAWSSTSWSLPSQASILTGRYPHEHGADWPALALSEQYPTLAEFFGGRGYVTGAFSGNSAWVTPEYLGRGFLRFRAYEAENFLRRTAYGRVIDKLLRPVGYHSAGRGRKANTINAEVLHFLADYPNRPFFVYLCYMDVNQAFHHQSLNRGFWRPRARLRDVIAAYDGSLRDLDARIGELMAILEARGALKNAVVVVTSDHGESFGSEASKSGLRDHDPMGHGTHLYPEQTAVPLFVISPGRVPGGQISDHTVSVRQIPATISNVLGLAGTPFVGESLPLVLNASSTDRPLAAVLATLKYGEANMQAVVRDRVMYLRNTKENRRLEELYDMRHDPFAERNIALDSPLLSPLRQLLSSLLDTDSNPQERRRRASGGAPAESR